MAPSWVQKARYSGDRAPTPSPTAGLAWRAVSEPLQQDAGTTARAAAATAGVAVGDLRAHDQLAAAADLFDTVWGRPETAGRVLGVELLRALEHAGNQLSGAFRDGRLVAATVAFLGRDDAGVHLHSHVTGVVADAQGQGVGWAMKQHQRAWALARGIVEVRWTFDPLVRRNAVFNLAKLGARATAYLEDHYGAMRDARNRGLPTDRLLASWRLDERRVALAAAGRPAGPRLDALRGAGATTVLRNDGGEPATAPLGGRLLLVQVPADIEAIRAGDRARAARWSAAVRTTLGAALRRGYRISGCTRDGWYALAAADAIEELAR